MSSVQLNINKARAQDPSLEIDDLLRYSLM